MAKLFLPPPPPTKHVTAVLTSEEHEILRRYSFERHLSLSAAIAELIRDCAAKLVVEFDESRRNSMKIGEGRSRHLGGSAKTPL